MSWTFHYKGSEGFEAWGVHFPSGVVILEWIPDSVPDGEEKINGYHRSVYESWEDFQTICTGDLTWDVVP